MEAPDRIYINGFSAFATEPVKNGIEYIRKDALLEWAKELNEAYHKKYEESNHTSGEHWGQMVAFQRMMDKLNSM